MYSDNIDRLRQFQIIYPEFWQYLSEIAVGLNANRNEHGVPQIIDDHRYVDKFQPVEMIGVCYRHNRFGHLITTDIGRYHPHPPAWCFHFYPQTIGQCKNSFQIDQKGRVHTITPSTGNTLYNQDIIQLNSGIELSQDYLFDQTEFTFALPVNDFIMAFIQ